MVDLFTMRKIIRLYILLMIVIALTNTSCEFNDKKKKDKTTDALQGIFNQRRDLPFDSTLVPSFYNSYPELKKYKDDVVDVYRQHDYTHIWYDEYGMVEFGYTLMSRVSNMEEEGVLTKFPYKDEIDHFLDVVKRNNLTKVENELMLTNLYLFYTEKVYEGIDQTTSKTLGWHLPRNTVSYSALIDSVMGEPKVLHRDDSLLYSQYYKLRKVLKQYRDIEKKGGWNTIDTIPAGNAFMPGDTGRVITQIRKRLYIAGDLKHNSKSNLYDPELVDAVKKYQKHNSFNVTEKILPEHVNSMNIPVSQRIVKIIINMERCRWMPTQFEQAREYLIVNIPSFNLKFLRNGEIELESPVIVGTQMTQTVIFSGRMSYIVFSPYWNLPNSIVENEVKPAIEKDKDYLKKNNMEWSGGRLRQKPGKDNSLGLVKFMFPNSNAIYLHDTPAKSLFKKENRAFSHGCIRVSKPKELAMAIMKEDPKWNMDKIEAAMNAGKESTYVLKEKIPVYIGYFTAEVDDNGAIYFYKDVYNMDGRLAQLLME
jgi:L,D-transpeptidase YcbB